MTALDSCGAAPIVAFTLTGQNKYRDAALTELMHAINDWRIRVDTAHQPPFDLMTGETCLTFGLAWDWLYGTRSLLAGLL
jgi:hypothetical protein